MQIVIDISKDRYDEIMAMDWNNCRRFFDEEIRAIHDGKPVKQEQKTVDLDKIRAEIEAKIEEEEFARSVFRHEEKDIAKAEQCTGSVMAYNNVIKIIDKYKAESEGEK